MTQRAAAAAATLPSTSSRPSPLVDVVGLTTVGVSLVVTVADEDVDVMVLDASVSLAISGPRH